MSNTCLIYTRGVRINTNAVECDDCQKWCHIGCGIKMPDEDYILVVEDNIPVLFLFLND